MAAAANHPTLSCRAVILDARILFDDVIGDHDHSGYCPSRLGSLEANSRLTRELLKQPGEFLLGKLPAEGARIEVYEMSEVLH